MYNVSMSFGPQTRSADEFSHAPSDYIGGGTPSGAVSQADFTMFASNQSSNFAARPPAYRSVSMHHLPEGLAVPHSFPMDVSLRRTVSMAGDSSEASNSFPDSDIAMESESDGYLSSNNISPTPTPIAKSPHGNNFPLPGEDQSSEVDRLGLPADSEAHSKRLAGAQARSLSPAAKSSVGIVKKKKQNSKKHPCEACGKAFPRYVPHFRWKLFSEACFSPSGLRTHMNTHNNIKRT
jgi:hypothetical protein